MEEKKSRYTPEEQPPAESVDRVIPPGATRAKQPPSDDLRERGILQDENYDRDSYDFGKPPVDPGADDPSLVAPATDPLEEVSESQFSRENASGDEEALLRRAGQAGVQPAAQGPAARSPKSKRAANG